MDDNDIFQITAIRSSGDRDTGILLLDHSLLILFSAASFGFSMNVNTYFANCGLLYSQPSSVHKQKLMTHKVLKQITSHSRPRKSKPQMKAPDSLDVPHST